MRRAIFLLLALLLFGSSAGAAPAVGKVAFIREGNLWVQELAGGEPLRLWEQGPVSHPRWSPSGKWVMVYQGESFRFFLVEQQLSPEVLYGREAVWSPVQDEVAFIGEEGLQVAEPFQKEIRTLVKPTKAGDIGTPVWSPDGRWIAYTVSKQDESYASIWRVKAEGGEPEEVVGFRQEDPNCLKLAGWSPNGQALLWWPIPMCSGSLSADGAPLMAVPAGGGAPVKLVDYMLLYPDFLTGHPTGGLAAAVGEDRISGTNKRVELIAPRAKVISPPGQAAISPRWSPDGKQIAFAAMPDAGPEAGGSDAARLAMMKRRIWVADVGSGQTRQVTDDPAYRDEAPRWLPGGLLFARLDQESRASLWLNDSKVTDLDAPSGAWFGYYGWLDWAGVFDVYPTRYSGQ